MNFLRASRKPAATEERFAENEVEVVNRLGLHARPASEFVRCAQRFQSRIELHVRGQTYSAQRVIDVLLAGLNQGTRFTITARGPDAEFAIETLTLFLHYLGDRDAAEDASVRTNRLQRFDLKDF